LVVPVGSIRIRSIEQVDVVVGGVGYFTSANLPRRVYDAGLGRTGSRKRGARRGVAGSDYRCRCGFSGHWREGWGKDGGGSVWREEVDIPINVGANWIVYGVSGTKLESGRSRPLALCVVP